jgi:N-methylhydantoinase A/oxoprolinase/acetone carboxylase beta subunit
VVISKDGEQLIYDLCLHSPSPLAHVAVRSVANLGFLERENASILNASILAFARRTVFAFRHATRQLGLRCPLFVAQNDGTVLPAHLAAQVPIRTFASGPTNSMCGAAFLLRVAQAAEGTEQAEKRPVVVVDIGGTSTDVGALLPSGFPRQAAATTQVAGVRMNLAYPDVRR